VCCDDDNNNLDDNDKGAEECGYNMNRLKKILIYFYSTNVMKSALLLMVLDSAGS
jgi:hypothetical protein